MHSCKCRITCSLYIPVDCLDSHRDKLKLTRFFDLLGCNLLPFKNALLTISSSPKLCRSWENWIEMYHHKKMLKQKTRIVCRQITWPNSVVVLSYSHLINEISAIRSNILSFIIQITMWTLKVYQPYGRSFRFCYFFHYCQTSAVFLFFIFFILIVFLEHLDKSKLFLSFALFPYFIGLFYFFPLGVHTWFTHHLTDISSLTFDMEKINWLSVCIFWTYSLFKYE